MKELSEAFGKFIFSFAMSIAFSVYNAWLFKDVWGWFVVPAFGVAEIGLALSFGLLMTIAWPLAHLHLFGQWLYDRGDEKKVGPVGRGFTISLAHSLVWVIGYVVAHNFV